MIPWYLTPITLTFHPCATSAWIWGDRHVQSFFWAGSCYERLMIQETPGMALQAVAQRNPASFTHPSCSASVPDLRSFTFPDRTLLQHTLCKGCTSAEKFVRANVPDGAPSNQGILICMLMALSIYQLSSYCSDSVCNKAAVALRSICHIPTHSS